MTRQELESLYLSTQHGVFAPNYTYDHCIIKCDDQTGDVIKEEYTNLVVHKTAQEVYEEWLQDNYELIDGEWVKKEQIDICPEDPIKVLEARVASLENVEAGLLFENAQHQIKIHEQEKKNKDQEVTNANLLLEIAILKGVL